ncbi:MAG: mevalonate kinase [Anaerolineae bacterium]|nr:mevalonate kinase [Anaerolineae bacterium]NUQ02472.1 mevalonate kinase [Anaerolineae bacterium]
MALGSAPAKVILFGEHAVVHGVPALAAPVSSLRAYAEAVPGVGEGVRLHAPGFAESLPVGLGAAEVDNALTKIVHLVLREVSCGMPNLAIHVHSDIPIASGMGSGAAVSAAVARALCAALNAPMDSETLNRLVYEVERLHHGTPSGIDNTVIVYEKPVYFVRGQEPMPLRVGAPIHLLIGDTGRPSLTRDAVSGVWGLLKQDPQEVTAHFETVRRIVAAARSHIEQGTPDQLGALMIENHQLLRKLTVSSPELDRLVDAALRAGASGAKMSGGGRGGIMIALVEPHTTEQIAASLHHAGAARVIATEIT